MQNLQQKIQKLKAEIPESTKLIAASKYVGIEQIQEAYEAGLRDFAESKVQDAIDKKEKLKNYKDITWHLIGHLQSNKVRKALEVFDWIHSVDSFDLLERINRIAGEFKNPLNPNSHSFGRGLVSQLSLHRNKPKVLLQIKLAEDNRKYGLSLEDIDKNIQVTRTFNNIDLMGLMTMLPYGLNPETNEKLFNKLRDFRNGLSEKYNIDLSELSMGMSADYKEAVKAGSTMLRLGKAIFV